MESAVAQSFDVLAGTLQRMPTLDRRLIFLRETNIRVGRKDAAEAAQMSFGSVYKMETGQPVSIDILKRYIKALDADFETVMAGIDLNKVVTTRPNGRSEPLPISDRDHIGKRIRDHRKKRLMIQTELAKRAFMRPSDLCNIEAGRVTPGRRRLHYIAVALGLKAEQLMYI